MSPGEAGNEVCTDPATPPAYTNTSLWQSQEATANQIETMKPDAVALLGDLQYQVGRYSDFEGSFDLTYGAFKFLHRPAPGNHEFYDEHGETGVAGYGYFSYYNGFQIDTTNDGTLGQPLTTTISDPCPTSLDRPVARRAKPPLRTSPPNPFRGRMDRRGTSSRVNGGLNGVGRRRWLVLLQSGLVAPYFAQYRVLDAAGYVRRGRLYRARAPGLPPNSNG